jgi:hypothetical protein
MRRGWTKPGIYRYCRATECGLSEEGVDRFVQHCGVRRSLAALAENVQTGADAITMNESATEYGAQKKK